MGRPTRLDDLVSKRFVDAVRKGASLIGASRVARIGWTTAKEWMVRGRGGEEPYAAFAAKVDEARGAVELELVTDLKVQSREGKTAATTFALQCLNAEGWTPKNAAAAEVVAAAASTDEAADVDLLEALLSAAKSRRTA